jgi:hypothetical protein
VIARSGSKRSKPDTRRAVSGAEADAKPAQIGMFASQMNVADAVVT